MVNRIKVRIDWKQKVKENFGLGIKRLLGAIGNTHGIIKHAISSYDSPLTNASIKILKDQEMKAEQTKAEAIEFLVKTKLAIQ